MLMSIVFSDFFEQFLYFFCKSFPQPKFNILCKFLFPNIKIWPKILCWKCKQITKFLKTILA